MKRFIIFITLIVCAPKVLFCQQPEHNTLNYYAVGNSMDGQPMIDMNNRLRFYPVYAFRDSTDKVVIHIYYGFGKEPYDYTAIKSENSNFWEAPLPKFDLGEAIQRIEVETHIKLDDSILKQYNRIKSILSRIPNAFRSASDQSVVDETAAIKNITDKIKSLNDVISKRIDSLNSVPINTGWMDTSNIAVLKKIVTDSCASQHDDVTKIQASISQQTINITKLQSDLIQNNQVIGSEGTNISTTLDEIKKIDLTANSPKLQHIIEDGTKLLDTLKEEVYEKIISSILDTNLSGVSVRRSDIIFDGDFSGVSILYRNYKNNLRYLPALDPAERLGIFRARYVPFPIFNRRKGLSLIRPATSNSLAVFEFGLGFGDIIVSGDDFVLPEFSPRRLGVAIALTEKLFNSDAELIALALTYEFNSYASLGFGANFVNGEREVITPYFSLGINQKAFERLLGQLQTWFAKGGS